jgi:hypothetical protein
MTDENVIDIQGGRCVKQLRFIIWIRCNGANLRRHPLQELCVDTFVPNHAYIVGGVGMDGETDGERESDDGADPLKRKKCSVVVCTGANACGKV